MSRSDRMIAVGQRRADQVVEEWAGLGDKFVFYALAGSQPVWDARLERMGVFQTNFKFQALFQRALQVDPQRTLDIISEIKGDPAVLENCKRSALEAVQKLEGANSREANRGRVREAVANALGSLASLVTLAD